MATDPGTLNERSATEAPRPSEMVNIDIAAEGDVILVFQQTHLRVSSAVLSSASPVFKTMFGPNFLEGQGQRSAGDPKEVSLSDDDVAAVTKLCRLIHHQYDHQNRPFCTEDATPEGVTQRAEDFLALAIMADKYGCADMIRVMGGSMVSELGSSSLCSFLTAEALITLAAASYIIADCHLFALFTRRLVLDYAMSYSRLVRHHALAVLPSEFLLHLEEQRKAASTEFRSRVFNSVQNKWCRECGYGKGARAVPGTLVALMDKAYDSCTFPGAECVGLRLVMKRASDCGNVEFCCCKPGYERKVLSIELRDFNDEVNKVVCGLCSTCLRNGNDTSECTHRQLLQRFIGKELFS